MGFYSVRGYIGMTFPLCGFHLQVFGFRFRGQIAVNIPKGLLALLRESMHGSTVDMMPHLHLSYDFFQSSSCQGKGRVRGATQCLISFVERSIAVLQFLPKKGTMPFRYVQAAQTT